MTEDEFMGNLYQRFPVTIEKGTGAHVWDTDGKEYIDCMGGYGVALVGYHNEFCAVFLQTFFLILFPPLVSSIE